MFTTQKCSVVTSDETNQLQLYLMIVKNGLLQYGRDVKWILNQSIIHSCQMQQVEKYLICWNLGSERDNIPQEM